jgi:hypothetical protein
MPSGAVGLAFTLDLPAPTALGMLPEAEKLASYSP